MFREGRGAELVYGVADYWVSRVKWSPEDQKYHLLGKTVITLTVSSQTNANNHICPLQVSCRLMSFIVTSTTRCTQTQWLNSGWNS